MKRIAFSLGIAFVLAGCSRPQPVPETAPSTPASTQPGPKDEEPEAVAALEKGGAFVVKENGRAAVLTFTPKSTVTDKELELAGKLTNLRELILTASDITDAGLEHLRGLKELQLL